MSAINLRGNGTCHIDDDTAQEKPAINHCTVCLLFEAVRTLMQKKLLLKTISVF